MKGCVNLAVHLATGDGVPRDEEAAETVYRRACDGGVPLGCHNLAARFADGSGVPVDGAQASALYEKACDAGEGRSCLDLGRLYEAGVVVAKDLDRAFAFLTRGMRARERIGLRSGGEDRQTPVINSRTVLLVLSLGVDPVELLRALEGQRAGYFLLQRSRLCRPFPSCLVEGHPRVPVPDPRPLDVPQRLGPLGPVLRGVPVGGLRRYGPDPPVRSVQRGIGCLQR